MDVGVDGTDEEVREDGYCEFRPGNGSLNFVAENEGEDAVEVGVLTDGALVGVPKGTETWCRGDAGRLLLEPDKDLELLYMPDSGEGWKGVMWGVPPAAFGVSSSSASSEMSHTLGAPECAYDSSVILNGLRVRFGDRSGEDGRFMGVGEGDSARWPPGLITVGSE
jgi:hypothetical protein